MIDRGTIVDRLITPFVTYEHLPTQTKYVDFPLANKPSDYQQKRYYSDEIPMKLEDFNKITKNKFKKISS